jgi:signal transduction histidine kinase
VSVRPWTTRFLGSYAGPAARLERVLAVGRAFLTVSALAAIYLDPTQPSRLAEITYAVVAAYAVYSLAVLTYVHRAQRLSQGHGLLLHGLDILWTAALTFVSEGPVRPFFLFFLFVLLAAAYRWGFLGTVATAGITVAVFVGETLIAAAGPWNQTWFAAADFELNHTVLLRIAYLLLTGFLLGYLAEQDKRSRAELAAIAEVTRQPRVHLGVGGSIAAVARDLMRTLHANAVYFILQDYETRETFLWRLERGTAADAIDPPRVELSQDEQAAWLFADPGHVWEGIRDGDGTSLRARVIDPGVWPVRRARVELPSLLHQAPFRRVVTANLGLADEWRGRVYLFDPLAGSNVEQALHFVDALVEHVTPALTNVFLLGRLRAHATATERARVARELHDGAIQSLFGVEMKVEALRRTADALPAAVMVELEDIQQLLQREVRALRELMQALRPIGLDTSDQLPDVLANVVERFRRDSGVPARFMFAGRTISLPAATALEIVRIVQEALVNVRKHSRARNVLVRLTGTERGCTLVVEDDGVGFAFEGALSRDELDRRRVGPAIIKERARIAGARLLIESTPGAGARIELALETPA